MTAANESFRFDVGADDVGQRLDRFCAARLEQLTRSQISKLNKNGDITVDGRERTSGYSLRAGEVVEVCVTAHEESTRAPEPEDIPVPVSYEDDDIIVVNKPAGMVVHPAFGNWTGTLVNALLGRGTKLSVIGGDTRPGIVHRLDKDTSGLMVVAKTDVAYEGLARQLKERRVGKSYMAIAWGHLGQRNMEIEAPIGRHPVDRQRMTVIESGRHAHSQVNVVDRYSHFDYIRVTISTGRTHQIRVHLSHVSHPILGDDVYGGRRKKVHAATARQKAVFDRMLKIVGRQALHASALSFDHPVTGKRVSFASALPPDMTAALEFLYKHNRIQEV